MNSTLTWFKSSYSGTEGGNCLEVAFTWQKSSYSNTEGGACVEVARCPGDTVHIRDSKNLTGPILTVSPDSWSHFTASVARISD
ncbi:DUF397 domain-containing protein [Streptomyces sp. JH002]|jgi:hypothetical protein|uniref:DUF397 domain-containing protein n=1 Tax=Streptomyces TaxID=1883 RepID=UPI0036EBAC08